MGSYCAFPPFRLSKFSDFRFKNMGLRTFLLKTLKKAAGSGEVISLVFRFLSMILRPGTFERKMVCVI